MRYRHRLVLFAFALAVCPQRARTLDLVDLSVPDSLHLEARRIRLLPGSSEVQASGRVTFSTDTLQGEADTALLFLESQTAILLHAKMILLVPPSFEVSAREAVIDSQRGLLRLNRFRLTLKALGNAQINGREALCRHGTCSLRDVTLTLCPHQNPGYLLAADRLVLYPSGALNAEGLVLFVHEKPAAALPRIHFRPVGKPGFSVPKIGFEPKGGLIAGPGGLIPLSEDAFLEGAFAVRSRQGFETWTHLETPQTDLRIDQFFIFPDNLLRFRLKTEQPFNEFFFGSDIDWVQSDRRIIDDLTASYLDRAITHTSSRILLSHRKDFAVSETAVEVLQPFEDEEGFARSDRLSPTVILAVSLPATPMGGHFFGAADARLIRRGAWGEKEDQSSDEPIPEHTRLEIETQLSHIRKVGPLSVDLDLATRHQKWLVDNNAFADPGLHLVGSALRIAVPLFRDFKRLRHTVSPYAAYRITPVAWGRTPDFVVDHFDLLRTGHGIEAGVSTAIENSDTEVVRADLFERIALNGFDMHDGLSYLAFRGTLGSPSFHASFDGAWDQRGGRLSVLGFALHRVLDRSAVDVGIQRLDQGEGPHRDQPFSTSFVPWLSASLPESAFHSVEVFQSGEAPLTKRLGLFAGARAEIYPAQTLHALWYGLKLRSDCGCLSASITASHRVSAPIPDIYASLEIFGL